MGIEEFFPYEVWKYAENQGWLEERKNIASFLKSDTQNRLILEKVTLSEILLDDFEFSEKENLYFYFRVNDLYKEDFAKYVSEQSLQMFSTLKLALNNVLAET